MISAEFASRLIGMIVFAIVGARLGVDAAESLNLPEAEEAFWFFFSLIGFLFGLIVTPYFTVRPFRRVSLRIREMPIEVLFTSLIGGAIGLALGLMLAYPLAQLNPPFNQIAPAAASVVGGYLGMTIFGVRSREIWEVLSTQTGSAQTRMLALQANRQLLLDTSVLIDGRIVDIARTGFLGGTLVIPRFVLNELHQVADSSDTLRRNRGRRGLVKLNELQRNNTTPVKIIEDDVEGLSDVDGKLVALAQQMDAALVTNDYPLSKVAEGQGVPVLNINLLANAVRAPYIPGETFPVHVIQTGSEENQGVGYLEDGTMVIVENGKRFMDRTIKVTVTKFISREAGRIYFAVPESEYNR